MIPNLVSIIIPAYNHASALPKCLAHVFAQTYMPYEVIVVDDGSTDAIVDAVKPFAEKIRLVRQQNAGANPARNRGWKEARGEFLLFCDADVVMRSDMLEKMMAALRAHPEASYAYSTFRFGWKLFPGAAWSADLLRRVNIAHTTSLVRAADFPGFDESIKRFQDWDVWLTMLAAGKCGVMVPHELFVAEIHGVSRIGSSWLPKMAYSIPWEKIGWMPKRVIKYRAAREIIAKKHNLFTHMNTSFRYSFLQKMSKKIYRTFFPVPKSPYTIGEIKDICAVNLVPPEVLKTFFGDCVSLLKKLKGDVIGDYLEFGVFNGSSLSSMHYVCKKDGLTTTRLFGFDAFQGLPEGSENEDDGVWKKGFYTCSFEKLQECLGRKNIQPGEIEFINGWYEDTLNEEAVRKYNLDNLGIVFIDCDTYSSSKAVLQFIAPLIKKPLIICCDDWKLNDLDIKELGEYKSFNEFVDENPHLSVTEITSYNRKSKSFLVRPK